MSAQNFEYKNAMERLEEILSKIDNSEMEIDELAVEAIPRWKLMNLLLRFKRLRSFCASAARF